MCNFSGTFFYHQASEQNYPAVNQQQDLLTSDQMPIHYARIINASVRMLCTDSFPARWRHCELRIVCVCMRLDASFPVLNKFIISRSECACTSQCMFASAGLRTISNKTILLYTHTSIKGFFTHVINLLAIWHINVCKLCWKSQDSYK